MFVFPTDTRLHSGLRSVLKIDGLLEGRQLSTTQRNPNSNASTFPSEVVKCRLDDNSEIPMLCKYSADRNHQAFGHRGGINYEVEVYRELLSKIDVTVPHFYGAYYETQKNSVWLVLEFLENCVQVTKSSDPEAMTKAARWIGNFHATCSSMARDKKLDFLKQYDSEYYMGWANRALSFADNSGGKHGWLEVLCNRFLDVVDILSEAPITIIHGEYYPQNIMYSERTVYPVDWESAALAVGEIDIASLTEGWSEAHTRKFECEYAAARWPEGAQYNIQRTIYAARIYQYIRWLGERPDRTDREWTLDELHSAAEVLGLV